MFVLVIDQTTPEYTEIFGEYEVVGGLARARAITMTYIVEKFVGKKYRMECG